jgi:hypothetical protein
MLWSQYCFYSLFINYIPVWFYYNNVTELFTALYSLTGDDPKWWSKGPGEGQLGGDKGFLPSFCPTTPGPTCKY